MQLQEAKSQSDFDAINGDEETFMLLTTAGFVNKLVCYSNAITAAHLVLVHQVLAMRREELDDIRNGLSSKGVGEFLAAHPSLWKQAFAQRSDIVVSAASLQSAVTYHHSIRSRGSTETEKKLMQWFLQYITDIKENEGTCSFLVKEITAHCVQYTIFLHCILVYSDL